MKNNFKYYLKAFSSETIKIKNTIGLWSVFVFPLFVVFMNFMIYFSRPQMLEKANTNPWINYSANNVTLWSLLFLPLYIAIITFYINYNDHKSSGWKHLFALPVPKQSIYISKIAMSMILSIVTMFFLFVLNYFSAKLLALLRPDIPFNKYSFDSVIVITYVKITLACMGVVSIQFFVSLIFQNFLFPLGFGVLATFAAVFLVNWEKIIYYPYAYSFIAAQDLRKGSPVLFTNPVILGLVVCLVVAVAGYYIHSSLRVR